MEHFSVSVQLIHVTNKYARHIEETLRLFSCACDDVLAIASKHQNELSTLNAQEKLTFLESKIHHTKDNPDPEDALFDLRYQNLPSYYRRSIINKVTGHLQSYESNHMNWNIAHAEASHLGHSHKAKEPVLGKMTKEYPAMYKNQMYMMDGPVVLLKLRAGNRWDWFRFEVSNQDYKDLLEKKRLGIMESPSLVKRGKKFYLVFAIKTKNALEEEKPLEYRRVMAVDLGINTPATCSLMDANGTVLGREFIKRPSEKAEIEHLLGKIKKQQRCGSTDCSHLWTKLSGVKLNYANQIARMIADLAVSWKADVIVFECLKGFNRSMRKGEKVQHWAKRRIQDLVFGMTHRVGIRLAFINPKNSSKLAFDGSGEVSRDRDNYSLCTFQSGKRYNCDLSASYNIGSRYLQRELLKTLSESEECQIKAKVPDLCKRTKCTLSSYKQLMKEIDEMFKDVA